MKRLALFVLLALTFIAPAQAGTPYATAVKAPPVCTRLQFRNWFSSLLAYRIAECPSARTTTYFFSQSGNDSNDGKDNVGFNLSGATWDNSTKKLTKTGAFTSYTLNTWDQIYITGGTGVQTGLYSIATRVSNDAITLTTSISTGAPSDVTSSTGPQKTLAAAQKFVNAGASDIRLRFLRGGTWQESAGLSFTGSKITIDDYGDSSKAKPLLTKFSAAYASGSWALTAAQTFTYEISESSTVAWVREKNDTRAAYVRQTSIATVEATPGSWWWDSGSNKLYVHPRLEQAATATSIVYEAVYKNTTGGIVCSGDNIRIQNIHLAGWSCCPAFAGGTENTSNYCIRYEGSGTNACLVIGCEAYYSTYHNIGGNNSSGSSGGIFTCVNCRAGRMVSVDGTNFVGFSSAGGQEFINYGYETVGGCVKITGSNYNNVQFGGVGVANYGHTDTAKGHDVGLWICWGGRNSRDQYQEGNPSVCANAPSFSDLKDCRAFVVDDEFLCRELTPVDTANEGSAIRYIGNSYALPYNGVYLNCYRESRLYSSANEANHQEFGTFDGTAINCRYLFDFIGNKDISAVGGVSITASAVLQASQWTLTAYNCSFEWKCNANTSLTTIYLSAFNNNTGNAATAGGYFNTLLVARNQTSGAGAWVGLRNDPAYLKNNAYSGFNPSGTAKTDTYRGYNSDPYLVDVTGLHPGVRPNTSSPLLSANNQKIGNYRLEFDATWMPRHPVTPAIGPLEPVRLYTPPQISFP